MSGFIAREEKEGAQLPAIRTSAQFPSIRRWIVLRLVCIVGSLLYPGTGGAGDCGGSIPCQCGDKVVADYQMSADLSPCAAHGLRLTSGVTLDCRKHVIRGPGTLSEHYGIYLASDTSGATVKNCEVTGFRHGIRLREARHNRILDNQAHHNGNDTAHVGYGIDVAAGSTNNLLQGNHIHHNADEGIHIGTGSHRNTLSDNQVYDNFRENIYVLSADWGVFKNNLTRGGGNSLLLKHAAFHRVENNRFHDRTAMIRGDSHDNQFIGNEFVDAGIRFDALKEGETLTRPTKNVVIGGKIVGAEHCLRFTGASGNQIKDTLLSRCAVGVSSTAASGRTVNTLLGIRLNTSDFSLEENAVVNIGWRLDVTVKSSNGSALSGARVKGFDVHRNLVFDAVTAADGKISTQDIIQYSESGSARTSHTPHTLRVTADKGSAVRQVTIDSNQAIVVSVSRAAR